MLMKNGLMMEDRASILRRMKVCRFCLCNEESDLTNIHEKQPQDPDIPVQLPSISLQVMACIAIEVLENDGMPQFICKTCRYITSQAYIFKTNCKKADDALKLFMLTGQLSKPSMNNVVQIKVIPATEKCISVIQEEEVEKIDTVTTTTTATEKELEEEMLKKEETTNVILDEESHDITSVEWESEAVKTVETSCFACDRCDRSFPLQQLLDLHMEKHTKERNFECEVCSNKFYTIYDLQKHSLLHNPKEFECIVCNKTFTRESFLRRHEKIHKDVEWYTCPKCDKSFMTKESLDYHMQYHFKNRPFSCKICGKSFVFKQGLERHETIHSNNKPHKCNYCEASFISAIKLTRHITSHAGLRPYPCKICGRTFLLSHHLTRHMRSHYSSNPTETVIGQYKCDICSMAFRRKDSLINHSAIHSMVNLKCVICNTTFESVDLVKEHITTHLTSLPFPCEKCDYSFETEEQLEEHELRHAEMEYEEQIEKEVFSENIMQITSNKERSEEDEDEPMEEDTEGTEISQFSIVDINNPEAGVRPTVTTTKNFGDNTDGAASRIEFLKDEYESEGEQSRDYEEEEEEEAPIEPIKPIVRQEGTKVYQRKNVPEKRRTELRINPLSVEPKSTPTDVATADPKALTNKTVKMGDKVVKVQKFILTTDEMKAMAKQGIIELRGGQVVLKSGQQVLNASIKPIQKNEIDSLLDKRAANKFPLKKYDKKVAPQRTTND